MSTLLMVFTICTQPYVITQITKQLSQGIGSQVNLSHLFGVDYTHRLNMELDLQSLFGLHVT